MIEATTLAELWDAHVDRLLLIAHSIGGPAEDAVQEAFISLATQPQLPADPMAWLVRVTRNQLLQWHRSNRRRKVREARVSTESWFDSEALSVDQRIDARVMTAALSELPSPHREVIVMHLWGEMTFESIAEVIGVSSATTHRYFQRGLADLRNRFGGHSELNSTKHRNV